MEIDTDTIQTVKMSGGYRRYMRLHAIVEDISSTKPLVRNTEWYREHNYLLHMYDEYFKTGFADVHPEIMDKTFRSNCERLDCLISKLMREFDAYGWFGLYDYLEFNKILIAVIDVVHETVTDEEDEDISNMFSGLSV